MITTTFLTGPPLAGPIEDTIADLEKCEFRCYIPTPKDCLHPKSCTKVLEQAAVNFELLRLGGRLTIDPRAKLLLAKVIDTMTYVPNPDAPCSTCNTKWCGAPHQGVCKDHRVSYVSDADTEEMLTAATTIVKQYLAADPGAALNAFHYLLYFGWPPWISEKAALDAIAGVRAAVPMLAKRRGVMSLKEAGDAYRALKGIVDASSKRPADLVYTDPEYKRLDRVGDFATSEVKRQAKAALGVVRPFVPIEVTIGPAVLEPGPKSKKPRRTGVIVAAVGAGLLLGAGAITVLAFRDRRRERDLYPSP
jgi:hypothetical protein